MTTETALLAAAWEARERAYPWKSGTKVGCAIEMDLGGIATGCNIEGQWMTSLHAEVVAVAEMAQCGARGTAVAIVSETSLFTPCGACLDWLIQFCDPRASVIIDNRQGTPRQFELIELAPHYPRQ